MLELPEAYTVSSQLQETLAGKKLRCVLPPSKQHKFCWYNGDPTDYNTFLAGRRVTAAAGFGIFAEVLFEGGYRLAFNDGVNVRLLPVEKLPAQHQLAVVFEDGQALAFTVAMYGAIILHQGDYENEYYQKSRTAVSPFSDEFKACFDETAARCKPSLSAKAFLAADQRFPGIGNGVLQDILFDAGIHPKRKLQTFGAAQWERLLASTTAVLGNMTRQGGRDTEKDLYGHPGGYRTRMSKKTWRQPCPVCGGAIVKETYLGGSVYYCPVCQPHE